ncbi:MAG TPA: divalent cation transporter [Halieaceae bacterium]|nr:divalent cation transporter [Halieaceae bacterium]
MAEWLTVVLLTLGAGITMPVGAALASVERIRPAWLENEFRHGVIAFGGGALLAAVALVLIPEGLKALPILPACLAFVAGALVFMAIDILLARRGTPASQLVAMLTDFLPEALALGATAAAQGPAGPLLAMIIALQNLPEGFNAFRELRAATAYRAAAIVAAFLAMASLGPLFGLFGFFVLADSHVLVGGIMLFAAGGILYLMFQDIAPQAHLDNHWAPPLGAILGFLLGLVGQQLVGH